MHNMQSEKTIIIELCGKLADFAGTECRLSIPSDGVSIAAVKQAVAAQIPALSDDMASPRTKACVNDAMVADSIIIHAGDRIALFPPVSGG